MELKLDVKTLIIGIALGIMITTTLGVVGGSADKADFGIALENQGFALVRTSDGSFYIVDAERTTAERVLDKSRGAGDRYFGFESVGRSGEKP